jgi:hypothetical protein
VQTVNTVRRMVEAGTALAVMGNHELNAIAWHTSDPAIQASTCARTIGKLPMYNVYADLHVLPVGDIGFQNVVTDSQVELL